MPGSLSNYAENALADHMLGGPDYTRPGTVYIAAYTVAPTDAGGGTEVVTTGGTLYARVALTNNATNFPAASGGLKSNGVAITFPQAGANWGTIVAVDVRDASSGGNQLYWSTLASNKVIDNGDQLVLNIGDLDLQWD